MSRLTFNSIVLCAAHVKVQLARSCKLLPGKKMFKPIFFSTAYIRGCRKFVPYYGFKLLLMVQYKK